MKAANKKLINTSQRLKIDFMSLLNITDDKKLYQLGQLIQTSVQKIDSYIEKKC